MLRITHTGTKLAKRIGLFPATKYLKVALLLCFEMLTKNGQRFLVFILRRYLGLINSLKSMWFKIAVGFGWLTDNGYSRSCQPLLLTTKLTRSVVSEAILVVPIVESRIGICPTSRTSYFVPHLAVQIPHRGIGLNLPQQLSLFFFLHIGPSQNHVVGHVLCIKMLTSSTS
jgi:hypothetical protein